MNTDSALAVGVSDVYGHRNAELKSRTRQQKRLRKGQQILDEQLGELGGRTGHASVPQLKQGMSVCTTAQNSDNPGRRLDSLAATRGKRAARAERPSADKHEKRKERREKSTQTGRWLLDPRPSTLGERAGDTP